MGWKQKVQKILMGNHPLGVPQTRRKVIDITGNVTLSVRDSGAIFTTYGAASAADIVVTLPALADSANCHYWFVAIPDHNMAVASAEGNNMIASGDIAASTVAYQTSDEIVGGVFYVVNGGTKWLVFPHLADKGQAITIT